TRNWVPSPTSCTCYRRALARRSYLCTRNRGCGLDPALRSASFRSPAYTPPYRQPRSRSMTIRHAACSCGQLHLTIEGEPSRISMCHCLKCQRRTGAVISNQARFPREQVTIAGKATCVDADSRKRQRAYLLFLPDMRLRRPLGERRLSRIRRCCHRQLRRPEFPCANHRGVGGVTPPLGLLAARHAAQPRGEAGVK